jgi:hypothetical protein
MGVSQGHVSHRRVSHGRSYHGHVSYRGHLTGVHLMGIYVCHWRACHGQLIAGVSYINFKLKNRISLGICEKEAENSILSTTTPNT